LAAEVHFAGVAPAFTFVAGRQRKRPQTANALSLGRWVQSVKKKENCDNFS
jgi:hypothetical protein